MAMYGDFDNSFKMLRNLDLTNDKKESVAVDVKVWLS